MEIKQMIEELDAILREDEIQEKEIKEEELTDEAPVAVTAEFGDTMSLADTLDAKTKIARALEALQTATEEFKQASAEKLDLLQDASLLQAIEGLDVALKDIEGALASGSNILGDSELNDAFKTELPAAEEVVLPEEEPEAEEEEEEENVEFDFAQEAGLDLLHPED